MEVGIKTDKRSLATLMVTDCGVDRVTIVIFSNASWIGSYRRDEISRSGQATRPWQAEPMVQNFGYFLLWLKENEELSGWAQFFGAMIALIVTYFSAFIPIWHQRTESKKEERARLSAALGHIAHATLKHIRFTVVIFEQNPEFAKRHTFWLTDSLEMLERIPFHIISADKVEHYVNILHQLRSTLQELPAYADNWGEADEWEAHGDFRGLIMEGLLIRNLKIMEAAAHFTE